MDTWKASVCLEVSDRTLGLRPIAPTESSGCPEVGTVKSLTALFFEGLYKYVVADSKASLLAI
jgi:hypothetical protein